MYGTVFKLTTKTHCSHYSAERRVLDCMALSLNYQNSLLRINTSHTLLHSFSDGGGGQYEVKEVYSRRLNLGVWSIGVANYAHQGGTKLRNAPPPSPPRNL